MTDETRLPDGKNTLPCAVARDLMPLEIDGIASPESAEMIKRHMERCEDCRAAYARMSAEENEQARTMALLPLRDVMRSLWHRLRLRAALTVLVVTLALAIAISVLCVHLSTAQWTIPCEAVDAQSVRVALSEDEATLIYAVSAPVYHQLGGRSWLEPDELRANAAVLHINSTVSWISRLRGLLRGSPKAQIRRSLTVPGQPFGEMIGDMEGFSPDTVITAVCYDEAPGPDEDGASILLWEASPEQYPLLTLGALDELYRKTFEEGGRTPFDWRTLEESP